MKVVAIIQARMGSSRLPGKVLMDLGGKTVLARVVSRLRRAELLDQIVVATTTNGMDDAIVSECGRMAVPCFRGPEDDVLDRYHQAAVAFSADVIVRVTSDCPLVEPELVDRTVRSFSLEHGDYACNVAHRTYPRGLDVEVFSFPALEQAWREAREAHQREHVTPYLYENPGLFRVVSVTGEDDHSEYRWTLDTLEDLQLIREIYNRLRNRDDFHWHVVLDLMQRDLGLCALNSHVLQKSVG